ncbi:hypothetical protein [Nostoc sp.]|uniref:hypothetical protein n=1 Tax=Nostoc sp. TaxID=1180 RepID=UPI002FF83DFD
MASIEAVKLQVSHHRVKVNGIRLHDIAAGSGKPVVLLHGFPETSYTHQSAFT